MPNGYVAEWGLVGGWVTQEYWGVYCNGQTFISNPNCSKQVVDGYGPLQGSVFSLLLTMLVAEHAHRSYMLTVAAVSFSCPPFCTGHSSAIKSGGDRTRGPEHGSHFKGSFCISVPSPWFYQIMDRSAISSWSSENASNEIPSCYQAPSQHSWYEILWFSAHTEESNRNVTVHYTPALDRYRRALHSAQILFPITFYGSLQRFVQHVYFISIEAALLVSSFLLINACSIL